MKPIPVKITFSRRVGLIQPAEYRIVFQDKMEEGWGDYLTGLSVQQAQLADGTPVTILTGTASDQSSLHGLLNRIRDLGLTLLLVQYLEEKS